MFHQVDRGECLVCEAPGVGLDSDGRCIECYEDATEPENAMHEHAYIGTCPLCNERATSLNVERMCLQCFDMREESQEIALELAFNGTLWMYDVADWRPDHTPESLIDAGLKDLCNDH